MRHYFRYIQRKISNHPINALLILLAVSYVFTIVILVMFESISLKEAILLSMPAFLGELGIVESKSGFSQFALLFSLFISIAFLAVVTAKIASMFVEFFESGGRIVKKVDFSGHIIVCGWNFQGEKIVDELMHAENSRYSEIVILANLENRPDIPEKIDFIKGDPTQDEDLKRAAIEKAKSVIILTDFSQDANAADAKALMITLAVESLNRDAHTCVQLLNSDNEIHLKRAHADEIICLDKIGGNIAVSSALNHGLSKILSELLTFNSGSEFYRYEGKLPDNLIGKSFSEVQKHLAEKKMILIGIETENTDHTREKMKADVIHDHERDRIVIVNPQSDYHLSKDDNLFIISEEKPQSI